MSRNTSKANSKRGPSVWSIGGSIFSMFFGAGNIVFPLALGLGYHSHPWFACLGMLLTAVCVPLLGLFAMLLYAGDYQKFFSVIGKIPGMIFIISILCLIGPLGGIPRAIAVSHSTLESLSVSKTCGLSCLPCLPVFSFICCILIYIFACKLGSLIQWLGSVFFPIMLATLILIIFNSLIIPENPGLMISSTPGEAFLAGVTEGFNTMDLLATFFFCSIVLISIRKMVQTEDSDTPLDFRAIDSKSRRTLGLGFMLAASFLALIYLGFALCAARHAGALVGVNKGQILGKISSLALGSNSLLTGICVFVACLTTEIALVGIIADFLARVMSSKKMTYTTAVICTLIPSYLISILSFDNISLILLPLLKLSYPALIVLTCGNLAHKLWHFQHTRVVFYLTLSLTAALRFLS